MFSKFFSNKQNITVSNASLYHLISLSKYQTREINNQDIFSEKFLKAINKPNSPDENKKELVRLINSFYN